MAFVTPNLLKMNLNPDVLAEKIVSHIRNDLESLLALGDEKTILKSGYGKSTMNGWKEITRKYIQDAVDDISYTAFFDGSAKPNPGLITIGGYIKDPWNRTIYQYEVDFDDTGTNNEAEYMSLIQLLDELTKRGINKVKIFGDSQLVVQQVNGNWKAKNERMIKLRDKAQQKLKFIEDWELTHIPREKNKEADNLTR